MGVSRLLIPGNVLSGSAENRTKHVETVERHIQLLSIKSIGEHIKISVIAYMCGKCHVREIMKGKEQLLIDKLIGKLSVPWS
jgi:hypothetical protein